MLCPYCQNELRKGNIASHEVYLYLLFEEFKMPFQYNLLRGLDKKIEENNWGRILATREGAINWTMKQCHYCEKCKKVILEY